MLDLCSGLGGASQPMLDSGWDVVRIENNPLLKDVPHTHLENILDWNHENMRGPSLDLIWASPPCREFSQAYSSPKTIARREGKPYAPNLDLMLKCKEIIETLESRYWVIENVIGAIEDFKPYLGNPRQIVGPFVLWGNFPYFEMPPDFKHNKYAGDKHSRNPLRANYRAVIPYPLADGLRKAIQEQHSILEWV